MMPCWFQVWFDTAVKKKYMNIQWRVVMKSKCSVWESAFRLSLSLLRETGRLCWWREKRDFICTDRAEILPCTFNGLSDSRWRCHCVRTDGGHFVLAKQQWFVCLRGHWWAEGQRNDPSVNTKQTSFSCSNRGLQNYNWRKACFFNTEATLCVQGFHIIYNLQQLLKKIPKYIFFCVLSLCSTSPITDDHAAVAFTGSIL